MLQGDRRRLELAYSLLLTMPGTPVIRYGDEIGMGENLDLPERECARTPMQWSSEPHGGFTVNKKPFMPVITGGPYGFERVNVADQRHNPNSFLNWFERMIRMRKEILEIGWGDFTILPVEQPEILAMRYDWHNNSVLILHNLGPVSCEVLLHPGVPDERSQRLTNVLSNDHSVASEGGKHRILLEPYGYHWYRVGGLDYLLQRTDF
jgi:maltose alpha-D-glucosyltransferase/alpha-amylase